VIAQTLQRSLLPASLPEIPGVELAVRYWPTGEATEVGGDFYDVFPLEADGNWAAVIGDVCGTGPSAAALTGLARHSIRDSAWHGDPPIEVLNSLNRAVARSGTNTFLTALYATLDTSGARPELTVTSGGHPLPIRAGSRRVTTIGTPGTLLGVFDGGLFHTETTLLDPGDVVVFYTDGATDVPPPNYLADGQFAQIVARAAAAARSAEAVADQIQESLDSIVSFSRRDDDIALLVLRVTMSDGRVEGGAAQPGPR
jgi:sigma-B regulation protein RsbU (phosphoserine phosphatase)